MSLTKAHNRMIQDSAVSVVDFGADKTGASNSAAAFQAAINTGSKKVIISNGTYRLDSVVTVNRVDGYIEIDGDGSVIQVNNTTGGLLIDDVGGDGRGAEIYNLNFEGTVFSGDDLSVPYLIHIKNSTYVKLRHLYGKWAQKGIFVSIDDNRVSRGGDSHNIIIENCRMAYNDTNLYAYNYRTGNFNLYGITVLHGNYDLAWSKSTSGVDGTGMYFYHAKEIVIINAVAQSNGYNGSYAPGTTDAEFNGVGYSDIGKGLVIDWCQRVRTIQYHGENNLYDITVQGSGNNRSEDVQIDGTGTTIRLNNSIDVSFVLDSIKTLSLGARTSQVRFKTINPIRPAILDQMIANDEIIVEIVERGVAGDRVQTCNTIYGSVINEQIEFGTYFGKGRLVNYLPKTLNPTGNAAWAVSNASKANYTDIGPHGLVDTTTTELTASADNGYMQAAAGSVTWDGPYAFMVWVKQDTRIGAELTGDRVRLSLRSSVGGELALSTFYVTDQWKPLAVTAYGLDGGNVTCRIQVGTNGETIQVWNPTLNKGYQPSSSIIHDESGAYSARGSYFPGGMMVGPHPNVKMFSGTAAPTSGTWLQGTIVIDSTPSAGGTLGWVCTTGGTPGTWKTFGAITA